MASSPCRPWDSSWLISPGIAVNASVNTFGMSASFPLSTAKSPTMASRNLLAALARIWSSWASSSCIAAWTPTWMRPSTQLVTGSAISPRLRRWGAVHDRRRYFFWHIFTRIGGPASVGHVGVQRFLLLARRILRRVTALQVAGVRVDDRPLFTRGTPGVVLADAVRHSPIIPACRAGQRADTPPRSVRFVMHQPGDAEVAVEQPVVVQVPVQVAFEVPVQVALEVPVQVALEVAVEQGERVTRPDVD